MGLIQRLRRSPHIHDDIADRFASYLSSGRILDLPAGDGVNSHRLTEAGYEVRPADLLPEQCRKKGLPCERVDMTKPLPYEDASFDGILNSEGIEHISGQIALLQELYRILKPDGILIVTTPNVLSLEGRLGFFLTGHARQKRALAYSTEDSTSKSALHSRTEEGVYFGHAFLINFFQLRYYLSYVGFEILNIDTTRYSSRSLLLAPFLYVPVGWTTRRLIRHKRSGIPPDLQRQILGEVLSGAVLFGRKLIMVAQKPPDKMV
jgi:SAM-dependent methyltransferase